MPAIAYAKSSKSSFLAPERLYSLSGFIRSSGISYRRISDAKKMGIDFSSFSFKVGRRRYVHGTDAIEFVRSLAEQTDREKELKASAGLLRREQESGKAKCSDAG